MINKRFFITEKGRFRAGAGNEDLEHFTRVEERDEVHLVAGCRVTMVLRLVKRVKGGGAKYKNDLAGFSTDLKTCVYDERWVYQLIRPCYIDGIMDGEATKEDGFSSRRIYLR
jgi:hypothetical protein